MISQEEYKIYLLTQDLQRIRELPRVSGGRITGNVYAQIRWGASITVINSVISGPDWSRYRLQITHVAHTPNGRVETPLGVFMVVGEKITDNAAEGGTTSELTLCDLTAVVRDAKLSATLTLNTTSTVKQHVLSLVGQAGIVRATMADTADRLRSALTFEPDTTLLKVVNEVLAAAGYFSLYAAPNGDLRAEKYLPPAQRPIKYRFDPGVEAIHLPTQSWEEEISRPNEIVAVSTSSGDAPALTAVARNQLPDSPYSYQNQGRWITETISGVEATSQQVLQEHAARKLDAYLAGKVFQRKLAFTPLALNDVVMQNGRREVVENISLRLTPGELMEVTSREVGG